MNPSTINESERVRLESIAAEYLKQGYDVRLEPRQGDLPDFLAGFEPDLIASRKGDSIVVEVKTRRELSTPLAAHLEDAVQNRPGWRFELIIDGAAPEHQQTLNAKQIRALLEESTVLERRKHWAAALLVLWSAIEGALRLLAKRENVELESLTPGYVLTRLYSLGLLGREQYKTLDAMMRQRKQVAHGYQAAVTSEDLMASAAVLEELLAEVEMKAA